MSLYEWVYKKQRVLFDGLLIQL